MNSSVVEEFIEFVVENYPTKLNRQETVEFITDFIYSIHSCKDFEISIRGASKWLKVHEWALKNTIYRSYKKEIDYIVDKQHTNGRPRYDIYLTVDCFKEVCMKSNSKRGKLVRKYFIMIENAYREYLMGAIKNRRRFDDKDYDDKNYQNENYPLGNSVYIIRVMHNGIVSYKIGLTKNLKRRLSEHRRTFLGNVKLILYKYYEHNEFLEVCVHRFLYKKRKRNDNSNLVEIFESDVPIIIKLLSACQKISESPEMLAIADGTDSVISDSTFISDNSTLDETESSFE